MPILSVFDNTSFNSIPVEDAKIEIVFPTSVFCVMLLDTKFTETTIMKTQTNTPNMETGSIPRLLVQLAVPAVVAQIINLLYNIVDRIYIGHIPGDRSCRTDRSRTFCPDSDAAECICHARRFRRCPACSHRNGKEG